MERILEYVLDDHNHRVVARIPGNVALAIYREVASDRLEPLHNKRAYRFTNRSQSCSRPRCIDPELEEQLWVYRHDDRFYITTERKEE